VTNQPVRGNASNINKCRAGGAGHRQNPHQHWNQGAHHGRGKFREKTKEIEANTFDNTGPHDAAIFNKSLKNITDYLQLNHGNNVSEAIRKMMLANIVLPEIPQPSKPNPNKPGELIPVSIIDTYLWKQAHIKASERDKNMVKTYVIIYHQFSPNLKNDLKASGLFPSICLNQDVIRLLQLIQGLCCSYDAKIQSVMATVTSHKRLFTCYQKDGVNNHTYHQKILCPNQDH
jgi:hypothetical protein